jgi:hydrogenase expression/formation protein HypE
VRLVAGDTKVVEQGKGDGLFVTTTGVGVVPAGVDVGAHRIAPGDVIIVSAPLGVHGVAIMSVREGLEFGTTIESDTAPLHGLVQTMLASAPGCVHALRDPTRGGLAAALVELAGESGTGIAIEERLVPVPPEVAGACGFLGLDVLHVANEGVLVAFVAPEAAETVLGAMRAHECGARAVVIGRAVDEHAGVVVCETSIGGARVVDRQVGEQLPRIC